MKKLFLATIMLGRRTYTLSGYNRWQVEVQRLVWALHEEEARSIIKAEYTKGDVASYEVGADATWVQGCTFVAALGDPA